MAAIKADPDLLEKVAGELKRIAEDIDIQKRTLSVVGEETAAIWKSNYTHQFLESVNKTKSKVDLCGLDVKKASDTLRKISIDVRNIDREIQRQLGMEG